MEANYCIHGRTPANTDEHRALVVAGSLTAGHGFGGMAQVPGLGHGLISWTRGCVGQRNSALQQMEATDDRAPRQVG